MALSKEAKEAKPKKPLNTYFRFAQERYQKLGDKEGKKDIVKK